MTVWTRPGEITPTDHSIHIKLTTHQWTTWENGTEYPGYDKGGPVSLVADIVQGIEENDSFRSYEVSRRASRTMFVPEILAKGDKLPSVMCEPARIAGLSLGPQYDMYVSFSTKEEATLFRLTFRGDVGVGFKGID